MSRGYPTEPTVAIMLPLEGPVRIVTLAASAADVRRLIDWLRRDDLRVLIDLAVRTSWDMLPDEFLDEDGE